MRNKVKVGMVIGSVFVIAAVVAHLPGSGNRAYVLPTAEAYSKASPASDALWDSRSPQPWGVKAMMSEHDAAQLASAVRSRTGLADTSNSVTIGSTLKGHFLTGVSEEQTLVEVGQTDDLGDHVTGWDRSFFAIKSGTSMTLIEAGRTNSRVLLRAVRLPGQSIDYILMDDSGMHGGFGYDTLVILSIDGFKKKVIADVGVIRKEDCGVDDETLGSSKPVVVADVVVVGPVGAKGELTFEGERYIASCAANNGEPQLKDTAVRLKEEVSSASDGQKVS